MDYLSLCCGTAIHAEGFAGHRCRLAIDKWDVAVNSHRRNYPTIPCICESIADAGLLSWASRNHSRPELIVATPPCPGFSAYCPDENDPRNQVYLECVKWITELRPRYAIIENVPGLLQSQFLPIARSRLGRAEYDSAVWILDAADFGTPQHRKRVILVAVPKGLPMPSPPKPTHGPGLKKFRTVRDAIGDMGRDEIMRLGCDSMSPLRTKIMEGVPEGGNWEALSGWRLEHIIRTTRAYPLDSRLCMRYAWSDAAYTIRSGQNIGNHTFPLHPSENRNFSVTEILRLMGVEREMELAGSRKDRYMLAGNGFCPQMARAVVDALRDEPERKIVSAPMIKRSVLKYPGGKFRLAPWVISHFPRHETYVEPYCGAASVLIRKSPCRREVLNDLDGDICNLFKVLQNPMQATELARLVSLTLFSRREYEGAYDGETCTDPVQQARRLIIRSDMGFGGLRPKRSGFRRSTLKNFPKEWGTKPDVLRQISERLKGVVVENLDALKCIAEYDSPETLFYCDPPYVPGTRTEKSLYSQEMTDDDHRRLIQTLDKVKGKVVLSGYDCPLYDELLVGWRRESIQTRNGRQRQTTETIWIKKAI